jgi:hypothetical protein
LGNQPGLASRVLGAATFSSIVIGFAFKDIAERFISAVVMALIDLSELVIMG